jgi:hypothetical protein
MLALIPILAFLSLLLAPLRFFPADWRLAFLRSATAWGVYMVVVTELLSLFHLVTVAGLALAWLLPCLATVGWLIWIAGVESPEGVYSNSNSNSTSTLTTPARS